MVINIEISSVVISKINTRYTIPGKKTVTDI